MNFSDIFKNSFLSNFSYSIDIENVIYNLVLTAVFSIFIFFVYRTVTRKTFYSKSFNISLIIMAIITAAIITTIQSNVVLSLGMVGALSIVRFRTAVKDPLDLGFLYWSISVGIICGAGLSVIAAGLCLLIAIIIIIAQFYPQKRLSMVLVISCDANANDEEILSTVKNYYKHYKIKSKTLNAIKLDYVIEINVTAENNLLRDLKKIDGVNAVSILSHDGEITVA